MVLVAVKWSGIVYNTVDTVDTVGIVDTADTVDTVDTVDLSLRLCTAFAGAVQIPRFPCVSMDTCQFHQRVTSPGMLMLFYFSVLTVLLKYD